MRNEIAAGIIIYRRTHEGVKFLLLYHGGRYWNFPKGKLAEGERGVKTALREAWEETGLTEQDLRLKTWFRAYDKFTFRKQSQDVSKTVALYLAETRRPYIRISSREHNGYGWFLYRDALRMLIHENLRNNLKIANDFITSTKTPPRGRM